MLDIKRIKNDKESIEKSLSKKMGNCSLDSIIELDDKRIEIQKKLNELQELKNKNSKEISIIKINKGDASKLIERMKQLGNDITTLSNLLKETEIKLKNELSILPNVPDDDVLAGGKENNQVLYKFKDKSQFEFEPKDHVELSKLLGLIDYDRGTKLSGQGSWIYTGEGAQLEWALLNYFVNEHIKDDWEFMLVPHMLNYECGYVAGQFPKFEEEVYWIDQGNSKNGKFLLPTAETALVNMHRNEILNESELPKKYFSYTPCYRKEAGSSRKEERGVVRGHQFNKVEMVQFTLPEKSDEAFEEMLMKADKLVRNLGLHYQVSKLAAGDCSASMCRTYDIEIWIPSMNIYKEVSSVSNCRDYQARRGNIKYRYSNGDLNYVNTLNGSGLATSRLLPAILEQYQLKDGSVLIPEILRQYMGNKEIIEPKCKVKI